MKLLILGGSGFVSRRLAQRAMAQGHEVWTVTRGGRSELDGVHALHADRNDRVQLETALRSAGTKWDAALDCICFNADQARADLTLLPDYTDRLVVISTDSVYDPYHKQVPQTEESDHYMQDGGYGCQKRQMEEAFLAAQTPLRWTILRPGHIFGPGSAIGCFPEHSRQKDLIPWMLADNPVRLVGGGAFLIHPIFVDDLADSMLSCIDKPGAFNEIFCIGGPEAVPNARYYELIGELIGHPARIETIPAEGYLEAHPEYSGHLCHRSYCLDKLAAAGIAMPATSLRDGLKQHIDWLLAQDK